MDTDSLIAILMSVGASFGGLYYRLQTLERKFDEHISACSVSKQRRK